MDIDYCYSVTDTWVSIIVMVFQTHGYRLFLCCYRHMDIDYWYGVSTTLHIQIILS